MSMKDLKITLDAAGSIFEMFPDSNLIDELRRIEVLSSEIDRMTATAIPERQRVAINNLRTVREHALFTADLQALGNDWRNVGGDFLNAYKKSTSGKAQVRRKDETESWSY